MRKIKNAIYFVYMPLTIGVYLMMICLNCCKCNFKVFICALSVLGGMLSFVEIIYSKIANDKEERVESEGFLQELENEANVIENGFHNKYGARASERLENLKSKVGENNIDIIFENLDVWTNIEIDNFVEKCGVKVGDEREVIDYIISLKEASKELEEAKDEEIEEILQYARESEEKIIRKTDVVQLFMCMSFPVLLMIGTYFTREFEKMADFFTVTGFIIVIITCIIKNNYRVKEIEELKKEREDFFKE